VAEPVKFVDTHEDPLWGLPKITGHRSREKEVEVPLSRRGRKKSIIVPKDGTINVDVFLNYL
jgi:hypothetical protein